MDELVRWDDHEIVLRKSARERGSVWCLILPLGAFAWGIIQYIVGFPDWETVYQMIPVIMFVFIALGASLAYLLLPSWIRIRFADRSYHLLTERHCITLRWRGHKGSCDDFACIRVEGSEDEEGEVVYWSVKLVWKQRRRDPIRLHTLLESETDARKRAKWLAERLGVPLHVRDHLGQPVQG